VKWILCGKNTAGAECLEHLLARGDEVWAIAPHGDDGKDGWQRSFAGAARQLGVPLDQPRRINAPDFVKRLADYGARALVSVQYDQILHGNLFREIGCPCLNLHFALLPRHRGVAPIAWAILTGDAEAGVTLHHMVEEIDAGDLIARRAVPIRADETARELYESVSGACVELFRESYPFPPELLVRRLVQDGSLASYHRKGDFDFSQRGIEWGRPAPELQRWIRALIFPPMQYPETTLGGRTLRVTRVAGEVGRTLSAAPGSVIARAGDAIDVAASGGSVRIAGLLDPADPDASSGELLASIPIGARFN
jgi:methionyl-tRNA formyltransferase